MLDTSNATWAKRAMWAPSIIEKDGAYYMFFGANDNQAGSIGVARARYPGGPFDDLLGRPLGETDRNHRVVCIDEMRFDASGAILPVVITKEGVPSDPLQK